MTKVSILLALSVALVLGAGAAPKANAQVVVGVAVRAPVYVRPVRAYGYFAPRPYVAYVPAPYPRVYVAPVYYRHWYPRRYCVRRDYYGWRR